MRQKLALMRARVPAAAEGDLAADGDAVGKGSAQQKKGSGKGKQGGKGGKAGGAGGKSPGKASREPTVGATAASVKQSQRERGRKSLENCVDWFCEQLDRTPRSTTARVCGNMLVRVCLLCIHLFFTLQVVTARAARLMSRRVRSSSSRNFNFPGVCALV